MKITINHLSKIEGQAGFVGHILDGRVAKAKIETQEGARLIEGILIGRKFEDAPLVTSRICGICPVVHNLCAIEALEDAFGIKVSKYIKNLRKLIQYGQVIHSHGLHLFFLTLPDFFDLSSDIKLFKKYPKETQDAIKIRDFGNKIIKVIGGRAIHPTTPQVGGFRRLPDKKNLKNLLVGYDQVLESAIRLANLFRDLKYPNFFRKTEFISLTHLKEYAIYQGKIKSSEGLLVSPQEFYKNYLKEFQPIYKGGKPLLSKRAHLKGRPYMVGALARINNNFNKLNPEAKKIWQKANLKIPVYNTFYNIFSQAVEIVHLIEEVYKINTRILHEYSTNYKTNKNSNKVKGSGQGLAAMEAPRGTLFHFYEIGNNGRIKQCNIITPTVQFLSNLEEDLRVYLPNMKRLKAVNRRKKIRALIRAYDPCITCATH